MPILLGGDDSVAEPFVAGWRDHGPVTVVQLDAHLDFRDEVDGESHGYSSPMRRASEMSWVRRIVHIGQRSVGSARPADVQDSVEAGNVIVRATGTGPRRPAGSRRATRGRRALRHRLRRRRHRPRRHPRRARAGAGRTGCGGGGRTLRRARRARIAPGAGGHGVRACARPGRYVRPGPRPRPLSGDRGLPGPSAHVVPEAGLEGPPGQQASQTSSTGPDGRILAAA